MQIYELFGGNLHLAGSAVGTDNGHGKAFIERLLVAIEEVV